MGTTIPATTAPTAAPTTVVTVIPITPTPTPTPTPTAVTVVVTNSDSTSWGWVIAAAVLVAAIAIATMLMLAQRRRRRREAWRRSTRPAVDAALLSRDLLPGHGRDITDLTHWQGVQAGAEQAAGQLKAAATSAANAGDAASARATAEALAGLTFALESSRLLQAAQPSPTATQLADADAVIQARKTELDAALARLDVVVGRPEVSG